MKETPGFSKFLNKLSLESPENFSQEPESLRKMVQKCSISKNFPQFSSFKVLLILHKFVYEFGTDFLFKIMDFLIDYDRFSIIIILMDYSAGFANKMHLKNDRISDQKYRLDPKFRGLRSLYLQHFRFQNTIVTLGVFFTNSVR